MWPVTSPENTSSPNPMTRSAKLSACGLLVLGTVLGLSGIDLVLPAIPELPDQLDGTEALAQLVIAAFVAGTAVGLLLFGALGERFGRRNCLVVGLIAYASLSLAAGFAPDMESLIGLRVLQGVASAAPAVFAPGIIRALFSEQGATRAIGALSSIESLTPAGAPILGLWLLNLGGWQVSFYVTAALAGALGVTFLVGKRMLPHTAPQAFRGSYARLMRMPVFLRYGISQALVVGGLLVFVFGATAVIVNTMGGDMADFIRMQVAGITCFIIASNVSGSLVKRFGAEGVIWFGTWMAALGAFGVLMFALYGDGNPFWLSLLFIPVNAGLGFRGPPGFLRAIIAGEGDDDRAASLTILAIFVVAAGGTALLAPVIGQGLVPLAATGFGIQVAALVTLSLFPRLRTAAFA